VRSRTTQTDVRGLFRVARPVFAAVVIAVALTMTGCAESPAGLAPTPQSTQATPTTVPSVPQPTDSPVMSPPPVTFTGTGPQTVTVTVPSPQFGHFYSTFGCTVGNYTVTLVESPGVFESGPCGGQADLSNDSGGGYEMPLPGAQTLHFTIQVAANSSFKFAGSLIQ
jgi:hypothetical protein